VLGASIYFCFTFVPMFIAYSATLIDPEMFGELLEKDSQLVLPTLVLQHTPLAAQVLFFGAVLSAIMSCSSATLLAPSVTFAENVVKGFYPKHGRPPLPLGDARDLVGFAALVLAFALNSESSIFEMVENAYKVTLAGAFVPLVVGIFWKRATSQGALAAIFGGLLSWLMIELLIGEDSLVPPQLIGLAVSFLGMAAGSLLPQWVGHHQPGPAPPATHHHAAAQTHHVPHDGEHHHQPLERRRRDRGGLIPRAARPAESPPSWQRRAHPPDAALYLTGSYAAADPTPACIPLDRLARHRRDPLSFLGAPWPRYYTGFDLAMPTSSPTCPARLPAAPAPCRATWARRRRLLAMLAGGALSLALETAAELPAQPRAVQHRPGLQHPRRHDRRRPPA
jgi:hypothetical protein